MLSPVQTLSLVTLLTSLTSASPVKRDAAIRDSPSGKYTPSSTICPSNLAIRIPVQVSLLSCYLFVIKNLLPSLLLSNGFIILGINKSRRISLRFIKDKKLFSRLDSLP